MTERASAAAARPDDAQVLRGVGRAFAGALLFALPIFMTMEMWFLATSISRLRLMLLVLVSMLLAAGLAQYFGIVSRRHVTSLDAAVDAGVAMLAGMSAAAVVLLLTAAVEGWEGVEAGLSVIALEALPATIGASFARSQLGVGRARGNRREARGRELFLMGAGAVVLAANIAPTEEVVLIAARMTPVHGVLLVLFELLLMHAFVYRLDFRGAAGLQRGTWRALLSSTVSGYVLSLGVSAYLLWTFGRFDGTGLTTVLVQTVVLALPAGLGAAAARLVV